MEKVYHPYHLVDPSPWPYVMGCGAFLSTLGAVVYFHHSNMILMVLGLAVIGSCMYSWLRDVIRKGTYQGYHTRSTLSGLKMGFILFIASEILLFISFFWAFFHSSLSPSVRGLSLTIFLGVIFTLLQIVEYFEASFCIADSVYGSTFFIATGFHGFHVLVGTIFLSICLARLNYSYFTTSHHFGFEAASWYWHFVDVVWLFLYVCIYWWGC